MKILVVDDSPDVGQLVVSLLESLGHEVISANDGRPGLELCLSERPDWIVTDMSMLFMDGPEMIKRVRMAWPDSKFIGMSGQPYGWDLPPDVTLLVKPNGIMRLGELIK